MARIMVGTPCGNGVVTSQYLLSFLETYNQCALHKQEIGRQLVAQFPGGFDGKRPDHVNAVNQSLHQHTIDIGLYTLAGESLLARGRNHIAAQALFGEWDKLIFIDADTGWTFEDFKKIVMSPHPLMAGVVPLKTYPTYPHNFDISLNFLPFQEDEVYFNNALRTLDGTMKMAAGRKDPVVKVAFTGTAFLCIARQVLMKMAESAPEYLYPDPSTGQPIVHWSFFDGGPVSDAYFSEDWSFCHKARELGFDVMINTDVRLSHTGNHTFKAG